ncbi:hypothetical protein EP331_01855 [bacterium]|nr:MAG: hypothetical protein EP331_01855 [bacterium]
MSEETVQNPLELPSNRAIIKKMIFEMKFLGIFGVISGGLVSLSIIGALFGIPMLISSLRLIDSAKKFTSFMDSYSSDDLLKALLFQRSYFRFNFWYIIISIVIVILYFVAIFMFLDKFQEMATGGNPLFS